MKTCFFHSIFFFIFAGICAQPANYKPGGASAVTINMENETIKTHMLNSAKQIAVSNDKTYLWFGAQKLMATRGGYDGKLLHGAYAAFYLDNQLKEKGRIRYGLRHKEWRYWYPTGKLKEIITWKNGTKHGFYALYNEEGQLMAKGQFKSDKLHGTFYTYGNGGLVIEKKKYRMGNEVLPTAKSKRKDATGTRQKEEKKSKAKKEKTPKQPKLKKRKTAPSEKPVEQAPVES